MCLVFCARIIANSFECAASRIHFIRELKKLARERERKQYLRCSYLLEW